MSKECWWERCDDVRMMLMVRHHSGRKELLWTLALWQWTDLAEMADVPDMEDHIDGKPLRRVVGIDVALTRALWFVEDSRFTLVAEEDGPDFLREILGNPWRKRETKAWSPDVQNVASAVYNGRMFDQVSLNVLAARLTPLPTSAAVLMTRTNSLSVATS